MLTNFLKDPLGIIYENLFFFLSLGKYDTIITIDDEDSYSEEFIIITEDWKDHIPYFENIIPIISNHFIRERKMTVNMNFEQYKRFQIYFLVYITPSTGRLVGLGLRIITSNSKILGSFAVNPEDRLQKAMYLISRGLLQSLYHRIEQFYLQIPI